ncbi:2'-5' RNA ligase [Virgibacillus subterraneus]|uniref:Putative phosphoesterase SAMN05216231_2935 n=2 Tax=Virgibacillus TaxID=84406 RepID=A0A1H1EKT4_9BACI|nr:MULTISPECIES: YjcG family protein [Virgibacillus]SDQ89352.1 2'-5' RNA ligase [Virgibacillus salinus]SEQ44770.1 2'-5' RNA ligase [Virgibacillus subterraneus]
MTKYGIAIFPSKPIQDDINSYRKRYDPHYALIPPHLTLKEAFEADDETIYELVTELKHIANDTEPFKLQINKVSTFAPVTNTIYLKVEPTKQLIDLFEKMQTGKFPENMEYNFVPHITIAQKLSHDEYSDVFGSMQMKDIQFEDTVDRFQLLYQLDNGTWTVYESFVFGKEKV